MRELEEKLTDIEKRLTIEKSQTAFRLSNLDESQGFSFYDKNVKMPYVIQNRQYYGLKDFRLIMRI